MCLNTISKKKFKLRIENGEYVGWRAFKIIDGDIYPLYYDDNYFNKGVWENENNFRRDHNKDDTFMKLGNLTHRYEPGFHIFLRKKDAMTYASRYTASPYKRIVSKVYFRDVVAHGIQHAFCMLKAYTFNCIIAKELFIPTYYDPINIKKSIYSEV